MAERIRRGSIFRRPEGQARRRTQRHKVAQKYLADLNEVEAKIWLFFLNKLICVFQEILCGEQLNKFSYTVIVDSPRVKVLCRPVVVLKGIPIAIFIFPEKPQLEIEDVLV